MSVHQFERRLQDRRIRSRGGRRDTDEQGNSPLILVIDQDREGREKCEVILAKLHFAVTQAKDRTEALRVAKSLHPELIVASLPAAEGNEIIRELKSDEATRDIGVVVLKESLDPDALVEEVRRGLRRRRG